MQKRLPPLLRINGPQLSALILVSLYAFVTMTAVILVLLYRLFFSFLELGD